jgi:hypothetical protein
MPNILYKSNGNPLATIQDGSINTSSTPLTFVGRNYAGYGEILNQNITSYVNGQEMRVEDWLFNWNNKYVITELNNFVDTSRNYELEEQIKDLQKQINEVKEINIEQNKRIEIIEEYVKPNK